MEITCYGSYKCVAGVGSWDESVPDEKTLKELRANFNKQNCRFMADICFAGVGSWDESVPDEKTLKELRANFNKQNCRFMADICFAGVRLWDESDPDEKTLKELRANFNKQKQTDLSLPCVYFHFVCFVASWLIYVLQVSGRGMSLTLMRRH